MKEIRAQAEGGNGYYMFVLGNWYQHGGFGLAKDQVQARAWYERSAAARDPRGMAKFSSYLLRGIVGPQNTALGLVYSTDAAHLGSDVGAFLLGQAFWRGSFGLPEDRVQARFWLRKVADDECAHKHLSSGSRREAAQWLRELDQ